MLGQAGFRQGDHQHGDDPEKDADEPQRLDRFQPKQRRSNECQQRHKGCGDSKHAGRQMRGGVIIQGRRDDGAEQSAEQIKAEMMAIERQSAAA
jgi:hypothetical protein